MDNHESFEKWWRGYWEGADAGGGHERLCRDAWQAARAEQADHVDRLRAENERMSNTLEFIRDHGMSSTKELLTREASAALAATAKHHLCDRALSAGGE